MNLEEQIGMRFTTYAEHRDLVADLYENSAFTPMRVEENDNGTVTFVFGKMSIKELERIVYVVPHHYSVLQGFLERPINGGSA